MINKILIYLVTNFGTPFKVYTKDPRFDIQGYSFFGKKFYTNIHVGERLDANRKRQ
jgi:hypothetical protein